MLKIISEDYTEDISDISDIYNYTEDISENYTEDYK